MSSDEIQSIKASLHRIEQAICGDEAFGHKGIAKRLTEAELRQEIITGDVRRIDRKLALWGGIVTGASVVITHLKTKFFGP